MSLPPQKISDLPLNSTPPPTSLIEISNSGVSQSTTLAAVVANYQLLSEKNQANGYAGLDSSAELNQAQIPVLPQSKIVDLESDLAARELTANKGAVSGYAGLDASQELLIDNFPPGTALQVLRRNAGNTALEFATAGGIATINGDGTAAQIIQGTLNRITVNDTGATHTLDIGTDVVTLLGTQTLQNKTIAGALNTLTGITGIEGLGIQTQALDMGGQDVDNIQNLIHDISTSGTDIDFDEDELQTISISANTTFTTDNRAAGKSKTLKITTDGTLRTLDFPGWDWVSDIPASQAASKNGYLTLTSYSTTDAAIVAAYQLGSL